MTNAISGLVCVCMCVCALVLEGWVVVEQIFPCTRLCASPWWTGRRWWSFVSRLEVTSWHEDRKSWQPLQWSPEQADPSCLLWRMMIVILYGLGKRSIWNCFNSITHFPVGSNQIHHDFGGKGKWGSHNTCYVQGFLGWNDLKKKDQCCIFLVFQCRWSNHRN